MRGGFCVSEVFLASWPSKSAKRAFAPDVPTIHVLQYLGMAGGYVYILTNRPNGILYVGVTNNLIRRVFEHRSGFVDGFTKQYGLKRLVYFEGFDDIRDAIQREPSPGPT